MQFKIFLLSLLFISVSTQAEITKSYLLKLSIKDRIQVLETERFQFEQNLRENSISLGREGNGGDKDASEFSRIALEIVDQIKSQKEIIYQSSNHFENFDLIAFKEAVINTRVFFVNYKLCSKSNDYRCPKEKGFDAKNYPELLEIHVNEERWIKLKANDKMKIVLHEYLGILGLEESKYSLSANLHTTAKDEASYNTMSCYFALFDKEYEEISDGKFTINRVLTSSSLIALTDKYEQVDFIVSYVATPEYLRIRVSEGFKTDSGMVLPKSKGKILFPETVIFNGKITGQSRMESDHYILQTNCFGF